MFKAHKFSGTDVHYHWICLSFLFFFFSLSPSLCSCIGNRLPHVLLILFAFSILPSQKLAPRCANPHFKARCLSAGNKAHRTYYGILSFPPILKGNISSTEVCLYPPKRKTSNTNTTRFFKCTGKLYPILVPSIVECSQLWEKENTEIRLLTSDEIKRSLMPNSSQPRCTLLNTCNYTVCTRHNTKWIFSRAPSVIKANEWTIIRL